MARGLIFLTQVSRGRNGLRVARFSLSSTILRATSDFSTMTEGDNGALSVGIRGKVLLGKGRVAVERLMSILISGTIGCDARGKGVSISLIRRSKRGGLAIGGSAATLRGNGRSVLFREFCHSSSSQGDRANNDNVNLSVTGTMTATRGTGVRTGDPSNGSLRVAIMFWFFGVVFGDAGCFGNALYFFVCLI